MPEDTVGALYALIGAEGLARLTAAFYRRVSTDDLLRPMYPEEDLTGAETRLHDFLQFRFGGPPHYITQRGHPRLRQRHFPFPIDQRARDRWVALMEQALDEAALPAVATAALRDFFQEVATFLINRATEEP
ncbi:MAG: globin [Candidatus Tectimicrobiota bacterium]